MKQINKTKMKRTFVTKMVKPIEENSLFFMFMLLVGAFTNVSHRNVFGYIELIADVYIICFLLSLCQRTIRQGLVIMLSCIIYVVSIIDTCCKTLFDTPITPTMLLLAQETTGREATEFFLQYLNLKLFFSAADIILFFALCHIVMAVRKMKFPTSYLKQPFVAFVLMFTIFVGMALSIYDKVLLYTVKNLSGLEVTVTNGFAHLYHPVERIVYGLYSNHLIAKQVDGVIMANQQIKVDSCSFTSPTIVLVIGESANRHHSQLYGYPLPTTPYQLAMMNGKDSLAVFTNVVSPWNLTSKVFKQIFSLQSVDEKGDWSKYVLFPAVFKKAGYHVSFLSNQFPYGINYTPDWTNNLVGGFFLNHPQLNKQMFDYRNVTIHNYDENLLNDYKDIISYKKPQLIIFHLLGQHFQYSLRCKSNMKKFGIKDYKRMDLTDKEKQTIADYDNATLYNDFVLNKIVEQFRNKDAIIVYLSDHGEDCYGKDVNMAGRLTEVEQINLRKYHEEFEIPFWIWCSPIYKQRHRKIFTETLMARSNKFMTDDLPHLLLYLAGIKIKDYFEERNVISPSFNSSRRRLVLKTIDYDKALYQ